MRNITVPFILSLVMSTAIFAGVNEDLIQASKKGQINEVKRLIRSGAKIHARDKYPRWNAIIWASKCSTSFFLYLASHAASIMITKNTLIISFYSFINAYGVLGNS